MIQRKQTLYLLFILFICTYLLVGNPVMYEVSGIDTWSKGAVGTIEVSILKIDRIAQETSQFFTWNSYLIYSLSAVSLLAFLSIFLYKNRKLQLLLCGFNYLFMAISGILMYFYFMDGKAWIAAAESDSMHYGFLIAIILPVWNFLAMRGIIHDERLIRSMDRLR